MRAALGETRESEKLLVPPRTLEIAQNVGVRKNIFICTTIDNTTAGHASWPVILDENLMFFNFLICRKREAS